MTELEFGFGMLWDSAPDGEHVVVFRELVGAAPAGWVDPDHDRVARFRDDVAAKAADRGVATLRYEVTVVAVGDTVDLAIVASGGEETSFEDLMVGVLSGPVRRRAELVIAESGGGWVGAERLFRDDHTVAVGRESLIGDVTAQVAAGGRVVLVGESGTGKSTIVCATEAGLRDRDGLIVVSVLVGASSTGVSGRDVVVRLVEQLQPLIGRELSAPTDGDEDGFIQWWRDVLTEAQTAIEGRLVIVVDALDVLADDRARSDVWPVRVIPPSIGLLCSTTSPDQAAALTGVGVDRLDVGDLSPAIAVEAARSWAGQAGRALPASVLAIVGEAARSPLWVRLAVDLLADLDAEDFASIAAAADQAAAIERLLFEEARSLPSDTADLAGVFLGRVAERIGDEPAALLLGVLATARSGLAPADLAALLPDDPDAGLTVAIAQRVLGDQLRTIDAAGRLTFAHAIVQWHAASLAGPGVHARIVEVLANDDVWDDTDALDVIWHTIAASAESDGEQPVHAGVLARAANHRPPGGELVLMRAIDAHPGAGIALIRQLDRSALTDGGMELFLDAPDKVDRRYVGPRDRVGLSMSVVGLARSGMAEARDRQVSTALNNLGDDCLAVGDLDGADVAFEESLELRRGLVQTQPGSVDAQRELSVALNRVAGFRGVRGDLAGAEEVFEESLELRRGLVQARPESVAARRDLSIALDWVGDVRQVRGDRDGALLAFEESLELARGLVQARPGSVDAQRELSVALNRVGDVRRMGGDFDGADEVFGESRALRRGLVQAQPGSVEAQRDLSVVLNRIGDVRQVRGELDGAVEVFEESLELARELARVQPGSVQTQRDLSVALNRVGEIRQLRGDFAGAVEVFEESLELARGLVRGQQESPQAVRDLLVSLRNVANILDDLNDPEGAARARAEAAELEVPPS